MLSSKRIESFTVDKLKDAKLKPGLLSEYPRDKFELWPLSYESPVAFSFESKEEDEEGDQMDRDTPSSRKIFEKRKSESWDYKPLERSSGSGSGIGSGGGKEPEGEDNLFPFLDEGFLNFPSINMISSSSHGNNSRLEPTHFDNRRVPMNNAEVDLSSMFQREILSFDADPFDLGATGSPFGVDPFLTDIPVQTSKPIVTSRRSEDWSSKPKLKRAKSMPIQKEDDSQKRRVKWTSDELLMLWKGILREGNNWKEISKVLTSRSYFQIKDKGRRLLFMRGWTTGRNKNDTDEGNLKAKAIARVALQEIK